MVFIHLNDEHPGITPTLDKMSKMKVQNTTGVGSIAHRWGILLAKSVDYVNFHLVSEVRFPTL